MVPGMSDAQTFTGSCHCGKVRYEVTLDLGKVTACNCSMCGKKGTLLTFAPAEAFRLLSGEDALTSYQFNKKVINHNFCSTCGVTSFARGKRPTDGAPLIAVNARCLEGVDIATLEIKQFDGRSL
jgi:hypothetical protein